MMPHHRATVFALCMSLLAATSLRAEDTKNLARDIEKAIEGGVAYLKAEQKDDGSWSEMAGHPGGVSALCTLALLSTGVPSDDPAVGRALAYLRKFDQPERVYSTSLQTLVFCAAGHEEDLPSIRKNAAWLEAVQIRDGKNRGAWPYGMFGRRLGNGDPSNSQFAVWALDEAENAGVDVNDKTWRLTLDYWRRTQRDSGAWGYSPGIASTGSMTCAGIASMSIASRRLAERRNGADNDKAADHFPRSEETPETESAFIWLGRNFSCNRNPTGPGPSQDVLSRSWFMYYLCAIQRVRHLTRRRLVGKHHPYYQAAEILVSWQDKDSGYWVGTGHAERDRRIATAFALLFLARGELPMTVDKDEFGEKVDDGREPPDN